MAGISAIVVICIWQPEYFHLKKLAEYAVHVMFALVFFGLIFLIIDQRRLLFTSLVAALILSVYLKGSSNESLMFPRPSSNPTITVALVNLSSVNNDVPGTFDDLIDAQYDILTFQEVDPFWHEFLIARMDNDYMFNASIIRIDDHGQIIFSKKPIVEIDTLYNDDLPALAVTIEPVTGEQTMIFSAHPPPALNTRTYKQVREYLMAASEYLSAVNIPKLCVGDFNLVSWSPEMRTFKALSNMTNSRRSFNPLSSIQADGSMSRPLQHIYFSDDMECTAFSEVSFSDRFKLGISGSYQFIYVREELSAITN
jgi:endonuclease/exonuclease/phosphatase family metal-dependent hydrolase